MRYANGHDKNNMQPTQAAAHVVEYDVLRVMVTLLVVMGHATYCVHSTPYGGCDYTALYVQPSLLYRFFSLVTSLIYSFHMPLFMALSGALFYRSFARERYADGKEFVVGKIKRLLIPYFLVGAFYAFPIKLLSGFYANSNNLFLDFILGQILIRDDTHLWYILTLFLVFLIVYLLEKNWPGHKTTKIVLMLCAFLANRLLGFRWQSPMEMTVWFYLGYCFEPYRQKARGGVKPKTFLAVCAIDLLFLAVKVAIHNEVLENCLMYPIQAVLGACIVYMAAVFLAHTNFLQSRVYRCLLQNSFGIYLYADPLNYLILAAGFGAFGGALVTNTFLSALLYLVRVLGTILASLAIGSFMRERHLTFLC